MATSKKNATKATPKTTKKATKTTTGVSKTFDMAGTEGTHEYIVFGNWPLGTVGVREYEPGRFRVRVEPPSPEAATQLTSQFPREAGWKQPGQGGQFRFSTLAEGDDALLPIVSSALSAVRAIDEGQEINLAPEAHALGLRLARKAKLRPNASWRVATLVAKLAELASS